MLKLIVMYIIISNNWFEINNEKKKKRRRMVFAVKISFISWILIHLSTLLLFRPTCTNMTKRSRRLCFLRLSFCHIQFKVNIFISLICDAIL